MNGVVTSFAVLLLTIVAMNIAATWRVGKSSFYEARQKWLQYALIWILPVIGAILCYALAREEGDPPSGNYAQDNALYDEGEVGSENAAGDSFGAGHHHE